MQKHYKVKYYKDTDTYTIFTDTFIFGSIDYWAMHQIITFLDENDYVDVTDKEQ